MTKVLIGIPVLDNIEITKACLQHLLGNTKIDKLHLDVEVLIVDNGSEEDVEQALKNELQKAAFPIHFVRNQQNLGVAPAWNQILKFAPNQEVEKDFYYDYYVISNNDALFGLDWLQPLVEAMESDNKIGWISTMENGSPVLSELIEAHALSKKYRVDPQKPYTAEIITRDLDLIYEKWGGHEDYAPIGLAEDLEYFLRMEQILMPGWLTKEKYTPDAKWKCGFCGKSIVHHNWCSTHQGPKFDGKKWGQMREKNWKAKFGKSKKYYTSLLP